MKDVLKSFDELNNGHEEPSTSSPVNSRSDSGKLSGLDAIRNAIQSNLRQQKEGKSQPPPPSPQQSTLDKLKSALEPKEKPAAQFPSKREKPLSPEDEQFSNKLYMMLHRSIEKVVMDIKNKTPIDPEPLIKQIPDFCTAIEANEYLFLKAIRRKRFATWIVSHSVNVGIFAVKIGLGLKYDKGDIEKLHQLALAAFLHDVGMVKVPTRVLFKHGRLSPAEFDHIRQHPVDGYELVKHLENDYPYIADTVYQEQEREDGSGYPQGLKSAEISEYAKIIGIADIFEALVHGRAYRDGFITYHAIQKIIENKSKQFNPKMIRGLVNTVSMFPIGSLVQLSSNEIARVKSVNKLRPVRPIVEVIKDSEGRNLKAPLRINLEEEPLLYITKPISET
ncbi:MAG: HD domain-containing protein [Candidatus Marinimicrobia bacterium]|nr:HD domain-containing protein [Candidatus Neomarinimicrobiota bacterium]